MDVLGILSLMFMGASQAISSGIRAPTGTPVHYASPSDLCPSSAELPSIADRLVPNHPGVERLVIFVYKKLGTNELITFVPSAELQNCIKDYPETKDNEIYNINTLTIETLYTHSTNKIIRLERESGGEIEDDQGNRDERPWEIIKCPDCNNNYEFPPGVEHQNTTEKTVTDETSIDKIIFDWKGPDSSVPLVPGDFTEDIISPISPPPSDNVGVVIEVDSVPGNVKEEFPELQVPYQIREVLQEPGQFQHSMIPPANFIIQNNYPPLGPWNVDNTEEITEAGSFSIETDQNYVASPSVTSINSLQHKPPFVQIFPSISGTGEGHATNSRPQWQLLNVPMKELLNNQPNEYAWAIKFPNINYKHLNQEQQGTQPIKNIFNHAHLNTENFSSQNFNSWLLTQLHSLKISGKEMPTSPADINMVKKEIEQSLKLNGFRLTSDGLLIDANGVTSSLSNLKLRPLLIGKSFTYNSLLNGANGKYKIPTSPLIEGLLLTLINPARILGLVTLGVTAIPQNVHDGNQRMLFREWNLQNHKKELPITVESTLHNFVLTSPLRTGEPVNSNGSLEIDTSVPPVLSVGDELEGGEDTGDVEPEGPGFRIIGGSSATGTGTPLAIKGRSRMDE